MKEAKAKSPGRWQFLKNGGAFRALYYRDFFLFWSSYFVSNVGSWMQSVAQGWLLFDLTSSPLYLGLFSAVRMVLLVVFFMLGGLMADRLDRRKVMLCIQTISALTSLGLAVLVSLGVVEIWHIFVLGAIASTAWAFEQPVRQALMPLLVSRDDLVNALALNALVWHGAGLLGPGLVGLSVGWIGIAGCFYVNVVSYLAVIAALCCVRIPPLDPNVTHAGVLRSLYEGLRYVRTESVIVTFLIVSAVYNIFGRSYITLLPVFAKDILGLGASGLGFLAAAPGLGTVIGALTLAALGGVEAKPARMLALLTAVSAALFAFAASYNADLAFACLVVVGIFSTIFETLLQTSIQLQVAEAFRGRVLGFYGLTTGGLREFGGMQAGFLAEWTSAPFAIEAGVIIVVVVGCWFFGARSRQLLFGRPSRPDPKTGYP